MTMNIALQDLAQLFSRLSSHGFISYQGRANTGNPNETWASLTGNQTGRVDMQGYMSWLRQHGYAFAGQREF